MPIQPMSAEEILEEFNKIFPRLEMLKGIDETRAIKHFIRISLASFLMYAAEQMKPIDFHVSSVPEDYRVAGWNGATQHHRSALLALAESINKTEV